LKSNNSLTKIWKLPDGSAYIRVDNTSQQLNAGMTLEKNNLQSEIVDSIILQKKILHHKHH